METVFQPLSEIVARRLLDIALERLEEEPVIALQGPRAVGKSTLLAELARARGAQVLDLDDLAMRDAVQTDPSAFVTGPALVCIDEYQHVPAIVDAIKAELNRDLRPGRFVITGSTHYDALPTARGRSPVACISSLCGHSRRVRSREQERTCCRSSSPTPQRPYIATVSRRRAGRST